MGRSMKRRLGGALVFTAAAGMALAGCSGGDSGTPASGDSEAGASDSGDITGDITFQTWNLKANFQDYFDGVIASFEEEYPGTSVKWIDQPADGYADKLSADAVGGTLPDVINLDAGTGYALAATGHLLDIAKADPEAKELYLEAAWDALDWKALGGQFAYPWYLNTGPMIFNTQLFDEVGLNPDALPKTYDELLEQANQMGEKSGGDFSMIGIMPTIETFGEYGIKAMNEDETEYAFNDEETVEFVQKYKDLYDNHGLLQEALAQTYTGEGESFMSGRLASMAGSAYTIENIKENAPSIYEHTVFKENIANTQPNMAIQSVGVNADTKNQATAVAFAKFVTNAENQLEFAKQVTIFPSSKGSLDDPFFTESDGSIADEVRVMCAKQIKRAVVWSPPTWSEAMKAELQDQMALAITGKKPIQQALDEAVAYANDRLSDY